MSAGFSPKSNNIQILVVTALAAMHLAMMLPSLARCKTSERRSSAGTSSSLQHLNRLDIAAPARQGFAEEGWIDLSQPARAEIAY